MKKKLIWGSLLCGTILLTSLLLKKKSNQTSIKNTTQNKVVTGQTQPTSSKLSSSKISKKKNLNSSEQSKSNEKLDSFLKEQLSTLPSDFSRNAKLRVLEKSPRSTLVGLEYDGVYVFPYDIRIKKISGEYKIIAGELPRKIQSFDEFPNYSENDLLDTAKADSSERMQELYDLKFSGEQWRIVNQELVPLVGVQVEGIHLGMRVHETWYYRLPEKTFYKKVSRVRH